MNPLNSRRTRRTPAWLVGLLLLAAALVGPAAPAAADPAGPTDYRTEIVAVEPATPQIELAILGGDSFVQLVAQPGTEVMVTGYRGEQYLWFQADGTVRQNELAPSRWLNDDRFGEAVIPPEADALAKPEWTVVADDGRYAWHDHRAHWMNTARPIGAEPGDVILEAVIPLEVDGEPVSVQVRSELLAAPSPLPAILGAAAALVGGVLLLARWRRGSPSSAGSESPAGPSIGSLAVLALMVVVAALATYAGVAAVQGLPAEAAPGAILWLLPLVAALAGAAAIVVVRGERLAKPMRVLVVQLALVLASFELLLWAWLRREALLRALIPTEAPQWLDRAVVAGAAAAGLVALAAAAATIMERRPAPPPTR
ncbi:MAG: hypothetical protein AAFO29_06490 [Actinomycetota bacterium]